MSIIHQALKKIEGTRHGPGPAIAHAPAPGGRSLRGPVVAVVVLAAGLAVGYLLLPYWPAGLRAFLNRPAAKAPALTVENAGKATGAAAPVPAPSASERIARGVDLFRTGLYREAAAELREAAALEPGSAVAQNNLATVLIALGEEKAAAGHIESALKLKPGYPEALNNRGVLLATRGDHKGALQAFNGAIAGDPALADAHFNRAVALERAGDIEGAYKGYSEYVRLVRDPDGPAKERVDKLSKKVLHLKALQMTRPAGKGADDVR